MVEACYVCRRTQADLDRINEEVRTRAYLSYFSNARTQIDEQQRRISFLQRLKDEESSDPHFRIGAQQVFGDPMAYKKLMPWIDTLIEIASPGGKQTEVRGTIGELVDSLLAVQRSEIAQMEEGLNHIRAGFATGAKAPLTLHVVTRTFPVDWSVAGHGLVWRPSQANDREPLGGPVGPAKATVEVQLHLCSACQKLTGGP